MEKQWESPTKRIVRIAIVAALYVALTIAFSFLSYGDIQFRLAEALIFLCFFRKDYVISLSIGCLISNIFSPYGIVDVIFGTTATLISVVCVAFSKKMYLTIFYPVIFNAIIIGLEISYLSEIPMWLPMLTVGAGELAVMVVGYLLFLRLRSNQPFMQLIKANQNYIEKE